MLCHWLISCYVQSNVLLSSKGKVIGLQCADDSAVKWPDPELTADRKDLGTMQMGDIYSFGLATVEVWYPIPRQHCD